MDFSRSSITSFGVMSRVNVPQAVYRRCSIVPKLKPEPVPANPIGVPSMA
jgi:hypothetical protein